MKDIDFRLKNIQDMMMNYQQEGILERIDKVIVSQTEYSRKEVKEFIPTERRKAAKAEKIEKVETAAVPVVETEDEIEEIEIEEAEEDDDFEFIDLDL